jgi:hypothetical protein
MLRDPVVGRNFRYAVLKHLRNDPLRPELLTYSALRNAVHVSSKEVLSVTKRKHAGWFNERQQLLMEAIVVRNQAQLVFNSKCKQGEPKPHPEHEILQRLREQMKLVVAAANISWMAGKIKGLGQGNKHPKTYWDCANNSKQGLNGHSAPVSDHRFRKRNGELCSTPFKNARTVRDHFQKVYNIKSELDPKIFPKIEERSVRSKSDAAPTHEEIRKVLNAARKDKAAGDSKIPVESWQILAEDESTESLFCDICRQVWETGDCKEERLSNRLKLVPKKGEFFRDHNSETNHPFPC